MDLAVLADDGARPVGQDRGVEAASLGRQFGVAEGDRNPQGACALEQGRRRAVRHLALEEPVDLGLVLHVPAWKEGGKRELRIDQHLDTPSGGGFQKVDHPGHDDLPAVGTLDRAHLSAADDELNHG